MYPIDVVIEMRLTGHSDLFLAPYYDNAHGTVSIEVCCSPIVPEWLWEQFKADLGAAWQGFNDGREGVRKARTKPALSGLLNLFENWVRWCSDLGGRRRCLKFCWEPFR